MASSFFNQRSSQVSQHDSIGHSGTKQHDQADPAGVQWDRGCDCWPPIASNLIQNSAGRYLSFIPAHLEGHKQEFALASCCNPILISLFLQIVFNVALFSQCRRYHITHHASPTKSCNSVQQSAHQPPCLLHTLTPQSNGRRRC